MSNQTVSEISSPPSNLSEIPENSLFDDPDADIILRSSDHREFRVLKLDVTRASPVLREAIQSALSSPTASTTPSLPSVQLSDSGATLSSLLSFILPMSSVLPSTIEQTMLLLSVAQKYQMEFIMSSIRAVIASQDPPFVREETALQVYSLAQTRGLRQEALHAARATLTFSFTLEDLEDKLATPLVDLHGLWKYHHRVRTYLADDLTAFKTTGVPSEMTSQPCDYGTLTWLGEYINSIAKSPALFDINEFYMFLLRHTNASYNGCECANISSRAIRAFWMALTNVVHDCMTRAESDIVILGGLQTETGPSPAFPQNASLPNRLDMANADIIIQSCDFINFRVHKLVLSLSSPFFNDMFSLPQPSDQDVVDGLLVVRLSEDADVLNRLLTMLYPIPSMIPNPYDKTLRLLAASQKYEIDGVQSRIRAEIQGKNLPMPTGAATFHAYVIASIGGWSSERETLARLTLNFPMTFEYFCDELPSFEGWVLRDLISFRKRCRDNLISCFKSFLNLRTPPFNLWTSCLPSAYVSTHTGRLPSWLVDLFQKRLTELGQAFTNPLPNTSNIREEYLSTLLAHVASNRCLSCPKVHAINGETFCKEIENRLALAIGKVGGFHLPEEFVHLNIRIKLN